MNKEVEFLGGNQISFNWVKENTKEEVALRNSMAIQNRDEYVEKSDTEFIVLQQWENPLEVFNTFEQECVAT